MERMSNVVGGGGVSLDCDLWDDALISLLSSSIVLKFSGNHENS